MIRGLECFKTHFADFKEQYVLIGGCACWVVMDHAGLSFRPTRDLDIVLIVEALNHDFVKAFHQFIQDGEYKVKTKSNGHPCFYRFANPKNPDYPSQIEILSRRNGLENYFLAGSITRMSIEEEMISLSAIIMNDDMYYFLKNNAIVIDDISVSDEVSLIPLKIRAWIDLSEKKAQNDRIKEGDILKHRNDVFMISQLLVPRKLNVVPNMIKSDVGFFIENSKVNDDLLKGIGIKNTSINEIMNLLKEIYLD